MGLCSIFKKKRKMGKLDLKKHKFPEVSGVDMAFPTVDTDMVLLEEAKERGYLHGDKQGNKDFSTWFYTGIEEVTVKDVDNAQEGFRYFRALMRSFSPKHEHKDAVCGMLIDEFMKITHKKEK
jgi:hypothetical protein